MNTKRKTLKMPVRYLMNLVLVGLLFVGLSYVTGNMLSTYQNKVLLTVGINIILAVSLNVATGYLGQLPLGHAGFMAVGAYACALFTKSSGLPKGVAFVIGLVLAWVIAGLFGVLIGIPALRLTGDYLAILTLGFGGHGPAFGLGLLLQCLGLCAGLRKDGVGPGSGRFGLYRSKIVLSSGLCGLEHFVQFQRSLRDGACILDMDPAVLQLRCQRGIFRLQLVLALLEGEDDLHQFCAVQVPQLTIRHKS